MKYYIIAGEASGDLHGSNLIKSLREKDPEASIRGWGGDLMESQGCALAKHYRETSFMGFIEVIRNLKTIKQLLTFCKKDILDFSPDAVIFIDYPGFNLRMAEFAHKKGFKTFYYISPQLWAWKKNRVYKIKEFVDRMFVILPFEKKFYANYQYEVDFVGHPLLDAIENFNESPQANSFLQDNQLSKKPIIALLPGSRKQEIKKILPLMLEVTKSFNDYQFILGGLGVHGEEFYQEFITDQPVKVILDSTYMLLSHAKAALVTSGTATLETALFGVPEVVCYKSSQLSYLLAKAFVGKSIKYISLVNLIADKEVVKELIQGELTPSNIKIELEKISSDKQNLKIISNEYKLLIEKLGGKGASSRTAGFITEFLKKTRQGTE